VVTDQTASRPETAALPTVSIAMATYNGEKYLREQLDSLAAQTMLPNELVVSDDGSTDRTVEIIQTFALQSPFQIRIFENHSRLGFADNFLKAAELCRFSIIAFCDQDDIWLPSKIERCVSEFLSQDVVMTVHSAELLIEGKRVGRYDPNIRSHVKVPPNSGDYLRVYPGFALMFRSSLLRITNNFIRPTNASSWGNLPKTVAHDGWIKMLASTFGTIQMMTEILALYRQHDSNTFGSHAKAKIQLAVNQSLREIDYSRRRDTDIEFATFFESLSERIGGAEAALAAERALLFRARASMHGLRTEIYAHNSNLLKRLRVFFRILIFGGYLSGLRNDNLGARAMVKDFIVGVSGIYKILFRFRAT